MFTPAYCPRCGGEVAAPVEVGQVERVSEWLSDQEINVRLEVSFYTVHVPHECKGRSA